MSRPNGSRSPRHAARRRHRSSARVVVVAVSVLVALAAVVVVRLAAVLAEPLPPQPRTIDLGPWSVLVDPFRPSAGQVVAAFVAVVLVAGSSLLIEGLATRRRRSAPPMESPGSPPPRCTVVIPAHNEEASLPGALRALHHQSEEPSRVVVIADNCSDRTAAAAEALGAEVISTEGNDQRKAGALNQGLSRLRPTLGESDLVLVMDADTHLGPDFIKVAAGRLERTPDLAAVGGVFYGEGGHGLLGQFQRNEYLRYSLDIDRRRERVFVLTGTASMFRASALYAVADARGGPVPGERGRVYDPEARTEDNEITIALKTLGLAMASPRECWVTTELMPTWGDLWRQRSRWQRGALENLGTHGLTTATLRYWAQQFGIGYGTLALPAAWLFIVLLVLAADPWIWYPFWITCGLIFAAERTATVWRGGWRARVTAATLLPEVIYDLVLQAVFIASLVNILLARDAEWGHVKRDGAPEPVREPAVTG